MDETLQELVSRYVDGDLEDAEAARLEARAETDRELAAAIDAIFAIRGAVSSLAGTMEPPADLDKVMEPLRQSGPTPVRSVRPVYRWLGAAAAIILGVSVAMEVARRNPEPTTHRPVTSKTRQARGGDEIFELAPLPTANPDEHRPLGAADHLLEERPPQPEAPEPAPLEVVGPLPTGVPMTRGDNASETSESSRQSASEVTLEAAPGGAPGPGSLDDSTAVRARRSSTETAGSVAPAPAQAARTSAAEDRLELKQAVGKRRAEADASPGGRQAAVTDAVVRINGADYRTGVRLRCTAGERPVRLEIADSTVVQIEPLAQGAGKDNDDDCRLEDLVGSTLLGGDDGSHLAVIVIQDPVP